MVTENKCLVVTIYFAAWKGLWAVQINDGAIHAVGRINSSLLLFPSSN
jgi:hypothetical protein